MPFFRNHLDIALATTRTVTPDDLPAILRLLRDGSYRFVGVPIEDITPLVHGAPTVVLAAQDAIWGVATAGWPTEGVAWIRGLAFTDGLLATEGVNALLPSLHTLLHERGVHQIYYAGDSSADAWVIPALRGQHYNRSTDVVVYEKHGMRIPSRGNQAVLVRRAQTLDLAGIIAVDHACFAPQWTKDDSIIGPAIGDAPFFVVAELHGAIVGYAFATTHFGGRLVHLVRIAVHPDHQGKNIAVRLLSEVVMFARTLRADTVALNTQAENHGAQRLYEWFGFRRTGEQQTVLRRAL